MIVREISEFWAGWIIGNFEPSVLRTPQFEIGVKRFSMGQREPEHYQLTATEYTVVVSGKCRIGGQVLGPGSICEIAPLESVDFEALEDCVLVAIKLPSVSDDKIEGHYVKEK